MTTLDPELLEGARNAVRVCLNVHEGDRVLIVTDEDTLAVGEALLQEAVATNAVADSLCLEEYGARPLRELPPDLGRRIVAFAPSVTFLAISSQEGELTMRGQFGRLAYREIGARHAHMPTITPAIVREGLRVDYQLVHRITPIIHEKVRGAAEITVRSARGSDLRGRFSDRLRWVACHGLYHNPGEGGNLPEGEVYTCPESVEGVLVADVVGDYFAPKYGLLEEPVTIEIEQGYARDLRCANRRAGSRAPRLCERRRERAARWRIRHRHQCRREGLAREHAAG